ncbi:MAG: hypothetical protein GW905_12125, partial [Rhodobacterales bacterium]|nr:hypothetical protein [Rhodobacterales bacterium]
MRFTSLTDFAARGAVFLAKGPVAIIILEDAVEVESTLRHHLDRGFRTLIVVALPEIALPQELPASVLRVDHNTKATDAFVTIVNAIIPLCPGLWLYYGFNAEYLFHPFGET